MYILKNIKKIFKDFVLEINDLHIKKKQLYVVTGPNGSGKTTFLKILGFLYYISSGEIFIDKKKVNYNDKEFLVKKRRKIAYLFQNPYLFNASIYDNIVCGLKIRGYNNYTIKKKFNDVCNKLEINNLIEKNIFNLSGGEIQKIAFARTLILDTSIFIFDEPVSSMDEKSINNVENIIQSIPEEKESTVIVTTHSKDQAIKMTKNRISFVNGKINNVG